MFEVQDLKYATLATVSRCGMVWFSEDVVTTEMYFEHYIQRLRNIPLDEMEAANMRSRPAAVAGQQAGIAPTADSIKDDVVSPSVQVRILAQVGRTGRMDHCFRCNETWRRFCRRIWLPMA